MTVTLGQVALRREHLRLMENLDPRYIADCLYTHEILPIEILESLTDDSRPCRDRCRELLVILAKLPYGLAPLLNALMHDNSFPFLCTELLITLGEVIAERQGRPKPRITTQQDSDFTLMGLCNPSREVKRTIFTKEHSHATKLYCRLRRLLNQGRDFLHEFDDHASKYEKLWEMTAQCKDNRQVVANRYFEVKILQMRKLSEGGGNDVSIQSLFSDIAKLVPYTSHPSASITSLLTIYAHALLTARKPAEDILEVLNEAKSNFTFLPGCRETSLVLITEFKVYWQMYEKSSVHVSKEELLQKAAAAAMHFASDEELDENPVYKRYLNRGLQFLQTLVNLGLGYTLRNIPHDCVTKEHVSNAQGFLKTFDTGEGWQHMELRWRMSYYIANAKIQFVQGNFQKALELAEHANDLSDGVHFKEENENIKEFIKYISGSMKDEHFFTSSTESESDPQLSAHDQEEEFAQCRAPYVVSDPTSAPNSDTHNNADDRTHTCRSSEQHFPGSVSGSHSCAGSYSERWCSSSLLWSLALLVLAAVMHVLIGVTFTSLYR